MPPWIPSPVLRDGNASRMKNARRRSAGQADPSTKCRMPCTERAQPVAPVPVATIAPDDGLPLRGLAERVTRCTRRLIGRVAHEHLVQRQQPLPIVERRLDHRALLERAVSRRHGAHQVACRGRCVRHEGRRRMTRDSGSIDRRLPLELSSRRLRDETVLAHRDDDVVGLEEPSMLPRCTYARRQAIGMAASTAATAASPTASAPGRRECALFFVAIDAGGNICLDHWRAALPDWLSDATGIFQKNHGTDDSRTVKQYPPFVDAMTWLHDPPTCDACRWRPGFQLGLGHSCPCDIRPSAGWRSVSCR